MKKYKWEFLSGQIYVGVKSTNTSTSLAFFSSVHTRDFLSRGEQSKPSKNHYSFILAKLIYHTSLTRKRLGRPVI